MRDRVSKRVVGWANIQFGRGRNFRHAPAILAALGREIAREKFDHTIFSGDATMMGFETEYAEAVALLGLDQPNPPPGIAVPGNHDLYMPEVVRDGRFERHFAPWLQGERLDEHVFPFAQKVGDLWIIGVNASRPTHWPWDASGRVGVAQQERLRRLLNHLGTGPKILVIHYPPCKADSLPEPRVRRLRDYREMVQIASEAKVVAWLCGHRHTGYVLGPTSARPFAVLCAGSATQANRWAYNDYTIDEEKLLVRRRVYSVEEDGYTDRGSVEVNLKSV